MPASAANLLRTEGQYRAFREDYASEIEKNLDAVEKWFNGLPLYQWLPYSPRPGTEALVTGLLCVLYIDGRINITFGKDMTMIERGAMSSEQYKEWIKER